MEYKIPEKIYQEGLALFNIAQATMNESTYKQSIELFEQSAAENNIDALLQLAYCYNTGDGVSFDDEKALIYIKKAADLGSAEACYQYAYSLYMDYEDDAYIYLQNSITNDITGKAHYLLGLIYYHGIGCEINVLKSFESHLISANRGYKDAMFELYLFYSKGIGVNVDLKIALEWNEKAANLNHSVACYNMGWYYETGTQYLQDIEKALSYYQKASDAGNGKATAYIGVMFEKGLIKNEKTIKENKEFDPSKARVLAEVYYNKSMQQAFYELESFLSNFAIKYNY